jgi:hypothetical protein
MLVKGKHGFGQRFDHPQQRRTILRAQPAHGHAKQDGEDRYLQNLVVGYRLRDVFRKGVQQHLIPAEMVRLAGLVAGNIRRSVLLGNIQPHTRMGDVDGRQPTSMAMVVRTSK